MNKRFVGYIAQQVESVVPSAVQLIDGILHVDYESLIPYLSESIRQNFNDIKNIKADNEKLQRALDSIYDAFIDKKSRDSSATITPFTEAKSSKAVSLPWRILIVSVAVITALVAVAAVVVFFTVKPDPSSPTLPPKSNEQIALEALFAATNGALWSKTSGWLTNFSICEWEGIKCNEGAVISISLHGNNLNGTIPTNINFLSKLQYLNLGSNAINGPIPESITSLTNLQTIILSNNAIDGTLPQDIGFLTEVTELNLESNLISGTVPKSISSMQGLTKLLLSDNQLHGLVLEAIMDLHNLTTVRIGNNYITGTIPEEIGKLAKLRNLDLSDNRIDGTLPSAICELHMLQFLNASSNLISGDIPEECWLNPSIDSFNVSYNSLRGQLPVAIGAASTHLKRLDLSYNYFFGTIPESLDDVGYEVLNLGNNAFTGTLLPSFNRFHTAVKIDLSFNQLHGTIPKSLFDDRDYNLKYCYLNNNNFTGTLPPIPSPELRELHVQHNQLEGTIPDIDDSGWWMLLDLSDNQLEGTLPVLPYSLGVLRLNNNKLNGTLDILRNAYYANLEEIDVSNNYFTGNMLVVPSDQLWYLNTSHNMLTELGEIPIIKACDASFNDFKCPLPQGATRCQATCV